MSGMRKKAEDLAAPVVERWRNIEEEETEDRRSFCEVCVDLMTTLAYQIRLEDAKAVCRDCANKGNWQDAEFANGIWFHRLKTSPYSVIECKSGPIHELRGKEGEGNG